MAQTLDETLRHAAWVLEHYGWSEGANARQTDGRVCAIQSSEAAYFSLYGALAKAFVTYRGARGDMDIQQGDAWDWITERAREMIPPAERVVGQHPVMALSDRAGMDGPKLVAILRRWADQLEIDQKAANPAVGA